MKVHIAADHAGYALKEVLVSYLTTLGYEVENCGASSYDEGDDYPDVVLPCVRKVAQERGMGIVVGASGQGEAIAANRIPGIRAVVYYGEAAKPQTDAGGTTLDILSSARVHNDANVLSLGARFITEDEAKEACRRFLETAFSSEERHRRRVAKLG